MEDSRIIDLFFERSEQAVEELDRAYGKVVARTAANILHSEQDVEETVNDTYLGVWNSIPPHRPNPLVSFVCRIARNLAVSKLRANAAIRRNGSFDAVLDELGELIPSGADVEAELIGRELLGTIERFVSSLGYDDRFVFVRRYWFADSVRDIAGMMGVPEGRVAVRLFRLRDKLKKTLAKEGLLV